MGSMLDLVVYAPDEQRAKQSMDAGLLELERLSLILSNYDANSEISLLGQKAFHEPIAVSHDLQVVLQESRRWHAFSVGRFDITVGPLSQLWRTSRKKKELPALDQIEQARKACGWDKVQLIPDPSEVGSSDDSVQHASLQQMVSLKSSGMRLDVSGLATGYIIATGTESILINAGGDIRVGKPPPGRDGWRVDVAGLGLNAPLFATHLVSNCAVTTSGDLYQYVDIDGRRYSHFIDPFSGSPIERRQSVTAFAATALDADAGATALAVMGMELGAEQFPKLPLGKAIFMQVDKETNDLRFRSLGDRRFGQQ
jgi:thiamine biosynthesis lipoprotein